MRRPVLLAAAAATLAFVLPAGADAPKRLPAGATIAGVPVAGMGPVTARRDVQRVVGAQYERPITLRVGSRDVAISTSKAGLTIAYQRMVDLAFKLAGDGKPVHVRLDRDFDPKALSAAVKGASKPFYRAPRDARVRFGVTRVVRIRGHNGRGLDLKSLRAAVGAELHRPTETRVVTSSVRTLRPRITVNKLGSVYSTYISVDRGHFKLRLFKRLRLVKTYPIAVGMAGHDTPRGIRHVLSKEKNPAWHVPNSPWAGSLAGTTVPPGSPNNPLKYAFIALGDGVGIHGTAEDWSIGSRASHGCIRMHVSDVKRLYPRVPVGTPVLIH
ncbi:MAG: L,D-transpeptidase family protein [Thermoleophilaceae bacterium]